MFAARPELRGLYAITDSSLQPPEKLLQRVDAAIDGGARLIQYRDKHSDQTVRRRQAAELAELCDRRGISLIINDDVQLALECGARGVHLGRDDCDITTARTRLGAEAIIGLSCYNQWPTALRAVAAGADYIAFGRFFPSRTKPEAVAANIELLTQASSSFEVPVAAIGGITPENGAQLVHAGADLLAVIHGVFGQPDVRAAARAYNRLFDL
jgi:thiamine-phosphate pyrophosphorylase